MDQFTHNQLRELLDLPGELCVSIYLPTHRCGPETVQGPIRLKNMLRRARRELGVRDVSGKIKNQLLDSPAEWIAENDFWQHQSDGLAIFLTVSESLRFRLPRHFEEQLHIAERAYVRPLLPLLQSNGVFYMLAISQNHCRLYRGNRDSLDEVDESELPSDLRSALGWWRERELNFHSHLQGPGTVHGRDTAMFHGHEEDVTKIDLEAYFRRVDAGLGLSLGGGQPPLVFAGVDYLFPIYRDVSRYPALCDEPVTGNPEQLTTEELHARGWEVVAPLFEKHQQAVLKSLPQRTAHQTATDDLPTILKAAHDGLVETLVIAEGVTQPGRLHPTGNGHWRLSLGDEEERSDDLIEQAVEWTLKSSGNVLAVAPSRLQEKPMWATLRAPLSSVAPSASRL